MPLPSSITDLSDASASNYPQPTDTAGTSVYLLPQAISAIIKKQFISGADVTVISSGTVTLPTESSYVTIQGTGFNITGFANCYNGRKITVRFASSGLVLVHSASLALRHSVNITTTANDVAEFVNESSGVWRCASYCHAVDPAPPFVLSAKSGIITKNTADASGSQVVSGLGFTPKKLAFKLNYATNDGVWIGNGSYDGVTNYSIVNVLSNGPSSPPEQYMNILTSSTCCIGANAIGSPDGQYASVTAMSSGQFTLSWTKSGSPTGTAYILWEAIG